MTPTEINETASMRHLIKMLHDAMASASADAMRHEAYTAQLLCAKSHDLLSRIDEYLAGELVEEEELIPTETWWG